MESTDVHSESRKSLIEFISSLPDDELKALVNIQTELDRAREIHPDWPSDYIYQAAIVQEESGELMRAALQYELENASKNAMQTEAVQTAAMALRFILKG